MILKNSILYLWDLSLLINVVRDNLFSQFVYVLALCRLIAVSVFAFTVRTAIIFLCMSPNVLVQKFLSRIDYILDAIAGL